MFPLSGCCGEKGRERHFPGMLDMQAKVSLSNVSLKYLVVRLIGMLKHHNQGDSA